MSDRSQKLDSFFRDFSLYSLAKIIPGISGLGALYILTRIFGSTSYGKYSLTLSAVAICATVFFGWIRQAVLRYESDTDITSTTLFLLVVMSVLVLSLSLLGYILFKQTITDLYAFYVVGVLTLILNGLFETFRTLFQARLQATRVVYFNTVRALIRHGGGIIIAVLIIDHILGWMIGAVVGGAVAVLLMCSQLESLDLSRVNMNTFRDFVSYGFPMMGWLFGLTLLTFIDRVLIELLQGTSAVGVYSANYTLVQTGLPLALVPIIHAAHPEIMDGWEGDNQEYITSILTSYTRYFLLIGIPATIFAAIISRPLSVLALGNEYHSGYPIIPIVAVALFFWNLAMIGHKGLELQNKTGIMTVGVVISVLVNIVFNYIFIPEHGYLGAAFATLLSSGTYLVFSYLMSVRTIRWRFPRSSIADILLAGTFMSLIGGLGYLSPYFETLSPIFSGIVGSFSFILILLFTGEIDDEDISMVMNSI